MDDPDALFEQWKNKQNAMGRRVPETFAPYHAKKLVSMIEISEIHQQGMLDIENLESIQNLNLMDCDLGLQASKDGRVWVCVNGIAFLRFKPKKTVPVKRYWPAGDLGDDCDGDLEGYDGPE